MFSDKILPAYKTYHQAHVVLDLTFTPGCTWLPIFHPNLYDPFFHYPVHETKAQWQRATAHGATSICLLNPYTLHVKKVTMKLFDELTERQEEVLALLAQGLSNREIARRLYISVYTANNHVQSLFATLAVKNRAAATNKYWQQLSQKKLP